MREINAEIATAYELGALSTGSHAFYERLGGEAEPARQEPGPAGGLLFEVAYAWPDIRTVF